MAVWSGKYGLNDACLVTKRINLKEATKCAWADSEGFEQNVASHGADELI